MVTLQIRMLIRLCVVCVCALGIAVTAIYNAGLFSSFFFFLLLLPFAQSDFFFAMFILISANCSQHSQETRKAGYTNKQTQK